MGRGRNGCISAASAALLVLVLCAAPPALAAPVWDPAGTVLAYSAALNAHDLNTALALFDENGSATDRFGHHFEGRAGLTQFLLGSGFGSPDARVATDTLVIVANRAFWTYACSCADGPTEVRLVLMNNNKISVFAVVAPPVPPPHRGNPGVPPWLVDLGLLVGAVAVWLTVRRGRPPAPAPAPRASQGRLLAALAEAHAHRRDGGVDPVR